jgi:hypothetical protein
MDLFEFTRNLLKDNYKKNIYDDIIRHFVYKNYNNYHIKKSITKYINNNIIIDQKGGENELEEYKLGDDNTYIVRLIHGDATDIKGKTHTIKFISVNYDNEESLTCAILNFDYVKKIAHVHSIGDYNNCALCEDRKQKYKIGQVLMIIIISICISKKPLIKTIQLQDNSVLSCMKTYKEDIEWDISFQKHESLNLLILRTIMHGQPYYCKYGFEPNNSDDKFVYNHNIDIFNKKIKLNTININDMILKYIKNDKHKEVYDKYIVNLIYEYQNKPVSEFIIKLLQINPDPYSKSIICYFLSKIYVKIFTQLNYKIYPHALFSKSI